MSDLAGAAALIGVAAVATAVLPSGDPARLLLTLPVLFTAPGYLLLEATVGSDKGRAGLRARAWHAALSAGASLPVVGLTALALGLVPGAFRPGVIVAAVAVVCLVLAGVAAFRRVDAHSRASAVAAPQGARLASEPLAVRARGGAGR